MAEAAKFVSKSDFEDQRLSLIWGSIVSLIDNGATTEQIDPFSVAKGCTSNDSVQKKVAIYASDLLDAFPKTGSLITSAQRVHRRATLKSALERMRGIAMKIKKQLNSVDGEVEDLETELAQLSIQVSMRSDIVSNRTTFKEVAVEVGKYFDQLASGPNTNAVPTGIGRLDKKLGGGLRPGQLHSILGGTGSGKCLAPFTKILKFDGSVIEAREVKAGDLLMGPDSKPRLVGSTISGNGPMYKVIPVKGDPWICNDAHVLTVVDSKYKKVFDINIKEYLSHPESWRGRIKQFLVGVEFPIQPYTLPVDPYFLGLWFGDGTKDLVCVAITTKDKEVVSECQRIADKFSLDVRAYKHPERCPTYYIETNHGTRNILLDRLRFLVGENVEIPQRYLTSSRRDRLQFLAGLIDSDGYRNGPGCYEIVQKRQDYSDSIAFLSRSLGLRATIRKKIVDGRTYYRVIISGDCSEIPSRLDRKKPLQQRIRKDSRRTGITVESIGLGDYSGFTLDGDGRFLLGDFTVTHNTALASQICDEAVRRGHRALMFSMEVDPLDVYIRDVERLSGRSRWDLRSPAHITREKASEALVEAQATILNQPDNKVVYGEPMSVEGIRQAILTEKLRGGEIEVVVVDHAQVAKPSGDEKANRPRYLEVKSIAEGLRAIARQLNIAMVLTAQLNPPQKGEQPTMDSVRESKDINNCSEVVMLIWHKKEEAPNGETVVTQSYILLDKVRTGIGGKVPVYYRGDCFRFEEQE